MQADPHWAAEAGLIDPQSAAYSGAFVATPNLLWPLDRSWCVAKEIDFDSTVVGGSRELIRRILTAPGLEALEVTEHTDLSSRGDRINGSISSSQSGPSRGGGD